MRGEEEGTDACVGERVGESEGAVRERTERESESGRAIECESQSVGERESARERERAREKLGRELHDACG